LDAIADSSHDFITLEKREIMKSMTCEELGGACGMEFRANTFEEIAKMSKDHGTEMFKNGDKEHIAAMQEMMVTLETPQEMQAWFESKRQEFEDLPED
jgi:predicted small metal-binding protein